MKTLALVLLSFLVLGPSAKASELPCGALSEDFNHSSVLACPRFAHFLMDPMSPAQAKPLRKLESELRSFLLKNGRSGDVHLKFGVASGTEGEVLAVPEFGLFYDDVSLPEEVNLYLAQLGFKHSFTGTELEVRGVWQGYASTSGEDAASTTFLTSEEWLVLSGSERGMFLSRMRAVISEMRTKQKLSEWRQLLPLNLPSGHYLDWEFITANEGRQLRLSTYFDYQWYSAAAPENNNYATALIEEFEVDLFHSGSH